ncbi:hypothetical protein BH11BAC3_BH11BAC3_35990 [soil metagenome]
MLNENINPYEHLGRLHNEGVEYVINKLNRSSDFEPTRQLVIELTAEFMFLIDCCGLNIDDYQSKVIRPSNIKYVLFVEFLANLQVQYGNKSIIELAKEANISVENAGILEMIFNSGTDIEVLPNNAVGNNYQVSLQMLDFLKNRNNTNTAISKDEKRAIGIVTSIAHSSIKKGEEIVKDPVLVQKYESVNSHALATSPVIPNDKTKKFRWPWKADAEGALSGLISGGIGGALVGPAGAAVGELLGAVGGSISNSVIKSIPFFNS